MRRVITCSAKQYMNELESEIGENSLSPDKKKEMENLKKIAQGTDAKAKAEAEAKVKEFVESVKIGELK